MRGIIEHEGTIISRVASNKYAVKILQHSACAGCQAATICTAAESKEKIVEAIGNDSSLTVGDNVVVYGNATLGYKAVTLAIALPLIISLLTLLIVTTMCNNEIIGGISALCILLPYYCILYCMRHTLKKEFVFYIKKTIIT